MKKLTTTICLLAALTLGTSAVAKVKRFKPGKDLKKAAETVTPSTLEGHIRFLADDLLEGREPGTRGDRLAQRYVASQLAGLGLQPGAENGSWYQKFELANIRSTAPETVYVKGKKGQSALKLKRDYVGLADADQSKVSISNVELVFVGYGIQAPEYNWDDYKGMDVKGKVLVFLNNDPEDDPDLFAGETRLYYGRWKYKYEIAEKLGAAGAVIIHTSHSAGYPWGVVQQGFSGNEYVIPSELSENPIVKLWITKRVATDIFAKAGMDLDALTASAQNRDFKPVSLGSTISMTITNKKTTVTTANVLGLLPGSDKSLASQVVVYSAHHDHLGKKDVKKGEDGIFNGAMDNASGVAQLLDIAAAFSKLKQKPKRSVLFAFVGAEESGLLGASYYANNPTFKAGNIAANINIDGATIYGKTRDLIQIGKGKSELDGYIESIAKYQDRYVVPDQFPSKGYFYRSDQFMFAKIGVPAVFLGGGIDVVGKPEGWGREQEKKYTKENYHQVSDEFSPEWNLTGAVVDSQLMFYLGYEVANAKQMPVWNKGDEFEAVRMQALKEAGHLMAH